MQWCHGQEEVARATGNVGSGFVTLGHHRLAPLPLEQVLLTLRAAGGLRVTTEGKLAALKSAVDESLGS